MAHAQLAKLNGKVICHKNAAGKRATVPFHASKILHPKLLMSILRDAEMSIEELENLL